MDKPTHPQRLFELIDACRADSEDLQQVEMRPLRDKITSDPQASATWDKSQQLDRQIRAAFRDVPVPNGLADDILSRLANEARVVPASAQVLGDARRLRVRRRRILKVVAVTIAASLLLVVAARPWLLRPASIASEQQLLEQAVRWALEIDPAAWKPIPANIRSNFPPPDPATLQWPARQWQTIDVDGRRVACYQLADPSQAPVVVIVLPAGPAPLERQSPPREPSLSTQGLNLSAWSRGGFCYIVIVEGSTRRYRNVVGPAIDMARRAARRGWSLAHRPRHATVHVSVADHLQPYVKRVRQRGIST